MSIITLYEIITKTLIKHIAKSSIGKMVGDGFYTVNYLINETTIMRAEAGGQQRLRAKSLQRDRLRELTSFSA